MATFTATNPCTFGVLFHSSNYSAAAHPYQTNVLPPGVASLTFIKLSLVTPSGNPATNTPSDPNRVAYSPARPGVLTIGLRALVEPVSVTPYITDRVVFDVDDIPGSTKTWAVDNSGGRPTLDGDYLTATVYYTNLPASNSGFGRKNARVKFDGVVDDTKCFWVFYPADAKNYAGAPPQDPDYLFIPPPNYFHYYMGSSAAKGSPGYNGYSRTMLYPPYNYFAAVDVNERQGKPILIPGVNGGNYLSYIDLFAWAARHEYSHHLNLDRFWGAGGRIATNDIDGDSLPDVQEPLLVLEGGPYDPTTKKSPHPPPDEYTYQNTFGNPDIEYHNCNSIHAEVWQQGSADTEDWAVPGNQWHP